MASCNRHFVTQKCQAGGGTLQQNTGMILNWLEVSPLQKKTRLSLPPSVFANNLCLALSLVFFFLHFSSCEDNFKNSALLRHALYPATFSAGCPYKETRKRKYEAIGGI